MMCRESETHLKSDPDHKMPYPCGFRAFLGNIGNDKDYQGGKEGKRGVFYIYINKNFFLLYIYKNQQPCGSKYRKYCSDRTMMLRQMEG